EFSRLLRSFLIGRTFQVDVRGSKSASRPILAGVPKGSVLGPVLYTIFTSDLPSPRGRNVLTATYADDTAILVTSAL
ncbi:hypothetical protein KR084_009856, partial [Drosophila pseudotakahashii]